MDAIEASTRLENERLLIIPNGDHFFDRPITPPPYSEIYASPNAVIEGELDMTFFDASSSVFGVVIAGGMWKRAKRFWIQKSGTTLSDSSFSIPRLDTQIGFDFVGASVDNSWGDGNVSMMFRCAGYAVKFHGIMQNNHNQFSNCKFRSSREPAIQASNAKQLYIDFCRFERLKSPGVSVSWSSLIDISRSWFEEIHSDSAIEIRDSNIISVCGNAFRTPSSRKYDLLAQQCKSVKHEENLTWGVSLVS